MVLKRLGAEHHIAIKYLSLPNKGGKTFEEIAEECNVHVNSIYNWRQDPLFERELKREMVRVTQDKIPKLLDSMIDTAIKDGNAAMAKLIMQANDMLTDRVEIEQTNKVDVGNIEDIKARIARYKGDTHSEE
jgi:hypothetical protein